MENSKFSNALAGYSNDNEIEEEINEKVENENEDNVFVESISN